MRRGSIDTPGLDATERLRLLYDAASSLLNADDPLKLLDELYDRVATALGLEVYFHFQDTGRGWLELMAYRGVDESVAKAIRRLEFNQAVCGTVAARRSRMIREQVQSCQDPITCLIRSLGITAYVCQPLMVHDRLLGTLSFGTRQRDHFEPEELDLLQTISHHLAVALDRAQARRQIEAANAKLEQMVAHRTELARRRSQKIGQLVLQISGSQQEERRRIAAMLHDHLQQLLVAAKMRLGMMRQADEDGRQQVMALITEAINAARNLSLELDPPILKREGLVAALRWLAGQFKERHQLHVELELHDGAEACETAVAELLFHAGRELLLNVVKHAGTDTARLSLIAVGSTLALTVEDRGRGCAADQLLNAMENSRGLSSLRQRVELLSGRLEFSGRPAEHCTVTVQLPCHLEQPAAG